MYLPEDKEPIKIKYYYDDGQEFILEEEEIKKYEGNIKSASALAIAHSYKFKEINWKKVKG